MAAALNAFMRVSTNPGKTVFAEGESKQKGYEKWIEIQSWEWEVEAESSWTKGSGAAVGKPVPGKLSWEHYWDFSSNTLLRYIYKGSSFPVVELHMCKSTGKDMPEVYWTATMTGAFITKVNQSANEEGGVTQKVEMVFKTIEISYKPQGLNRTEPGKLDASSLMNWDIETGRVG